MLPWMIYNIPWSIEVEQNWMIESEPTIFLFHAINAFQGPMRLLFFLPLHILGLNAISSVILKSQEIVQLNHGSCEFSGWSCKQKNGHILALIQRLINIESVIHHHRRHQNQTIAPRKCPCDHPTQRERRKRNRRSCCRHPINISWWRWPERMK